VSEQKRQAFVCGDKTSNVDEIRKVLAQATGDTNIKSDAVSKAIENTSVGSVVFAMKPGDGSAREQAASCQKVLGGFANIAVEYATKRYRSNLINWGMIPFTIPESEDINFEVGDYVFVEGIHDIIKSGQEDMEAQVISSKGNRKIKLQLKNLTKDEKQILLAGCLINFNAINKK